MIGEFLSGNASPYRHLQLEVCGSTNTECLNAAADGDPGNLWITSDTQTGGKGSRGRSWTSEKGNLFASLLLVDPSDPKYLSELTFLAAIAVGDTLREVFGRSSDQKIGLKWPNDVLVNGKKISGILLEGGSRKNSSNVAVGIGINCASSPPDTRYPATSLYALGCDVETGQVFLKLARHFAGLLAVWDRGRNFEAIRQLWLQNAVGIGQGIEIRLEGQEPLPGVFETLNADGHLLLRTESGKIRTICVGDVFFQSASKSGD